jgi:RecA-family ATPase
MTNFDLSQGTKIRNQRVEQIRAALTAATDTQHIEHRPYLVKSWLDLDATSLVYGQSNTGKSFLTLDVAFYVAAGWRWNNCRVTQSNVIYVAAEGGTGFSKRIRAIATCNPDLFEAAKEHFHHLPLQLDLHGKEDVEALLTAIAERPVDLLIIDTLAMSLGAGNENDGKDVTQFLTHIAEIRQKLGCHVMLVHHSGKDQGKGARGHSSLRAAVDTEIEVSMDGLMRLATTKKQRDLEGGKVAAFNLNVINLGNDKDGEPITSCTVQPQDADELKRSKKQKLSGNYQVAHQALHDALKNEGSRVLNSESYPSSRKIVNSEAWYLEFQMRRASDNVKEDNNRKAFKRARNWLQEHDYTREYDDKVWFIDEPDRQDK